MKQNLLPRAVILTTDCGTEVDDQWALAHLALSPEIDLRGVVTTHAPNVTPPAAEKSASIVRDILGNLSLASIPPVFAGSSVPLSGKSTPSPNPGVDFILDQSREFDFDNRLTIIAIGAATDVASAFITDPTLSKRAEVLAMGFLNWQDGGREWNVKNDVAAWQMLLDSDTEITIGSATIAVRDLQMSVSRACELFGNCSARGSYITQMLTDWFTVHSGIAAQVTGKPDHWPIWDSITVAYLLGLTESQLMPRPVMLDDMSFKARQDEGAYVRWITAVDAPRLWNDLAIKLS